MFCLGGGGALGETEALGLLDADGDRLGLTDGDTDGDRLGETEALGDNDAEGLLANRVDIEI